MDLKRKSDGAVVKGVFDISDIPGDDKWCKVTDDSRIHYYSSSRWEPVEEWITIQINKDDLDIMRNAGDIRYKVVK